MNKINSFAFSCAILLLICSCERLKGEYSMGDHLHLWDNDKKEERIIVYCEGNCNGGIYVVPTYKRHYDSAGNFAEFVEEAEFDKNFVIVKTWRITEKENRYYLISKNFNFTAQNLQNFDRDSLLQSHVTGPLDFEEFEEKRRLLKTDLQFKR